MSARLADFTPIDDTVLLPAILGLDPLQARLLLVEVAGSAVLDLGSGRSITFAGVPAAAITASDFGVT